ncbi:succinylglutamate desuccinylase [Arcobacter sp. CECT 8989]|uniref:DUF1826 domain-containing protein n=1 Tax=Arcobacter sp. CECT 8989 TaxID=2044509 RepID=UPI00100BAF33|nr:DUF1826 domain-containing protein [Arcobacter sp. CECT 8989]RXK01476.1 succinylglutamate desuccinylase [Arcobacter sp. CECT 8989]
MTKKNCNIASEWAQAEKISQHMVHGKQPTVLSDIYQEKINIAIWQRERPNSLKSSVKEFLELNPTFQKEMTLTPQDALSRVNEFFDNKMTEVSEDIAALVDMFCYLFELKEAGVRLKVLDKAMCPKFHVDKVPCRLVTTYQGTATEWLPHEVVDQTKLGWGCNGLPDSESGLYQSESNIQQLACGDVALIKGTLWDGNENVGLVHRSPELISNEKRLILTLDF